MDRNPYLPHSPHPRQRQFLYLADVLEVLYGGAAGGGKSDALLAAAAQFVHVPGYAALLLRRTFPDLNQPDALIPRSKDWWAATEAGWHQQNRRWTFPCPGGGEATVTFGYLERDDDVYQYQGAAFQFIGIDELTQHTEFRYRYLFSRLRKPESGPLADVPLRMRSGSNPGGVGHEWVKKRFIDPRTRDRGTVFIPAKLADNPTLDAARYVEALSHVDPLTRAQLLAGDWDAVAGGRFKREWFRYYRREQYQPDHVTCAEGRWRYIPRTRLVFAAVDWAASAKQTADYTVIGVFGLSPTNDLVWLDCVRVQKEIPDLVPLVVQAARKWGCQFVAVETVASNKELYTRLTRDTTIPTRALSPRGQDKLVRATPAMVLAEQGKVYLPEDNPLFPVDDVLGELVRFTGDEKQDANDDVVDCLAYAAHVAFGEPGSPAAPGVYSSGGPFDGRTVGPPPRPGGVRVMGPGGAPGLGRSRG